MIHKYFTDLGARLRLTAKKNITTNCSIRQRRSLPSAASLYPVGELLMATGQPLLSLFSCPIHSIFEKHNQGGPQGKGQALISYRRCDLLHDLIIDRHCRKRIRGRRTQRASLSRSCDNVIKNHGALNTRRWCEDWGGTLLNCQCVGTKSLRSGGMSSLNRDFLDAHKHVYVGGTTLSRRTYNETVSHHVHTDNSVWRLSACLMLPLLSSHGCWGSSTQVSTFSPVAWSTSVWKVRRGCDWFTDSHKALSRSVVRDIGKCASLKTYKSYRI